MARDHEHLFEGLLSVTPRKQSIHPPKAVLKAYAQGRLGLAPDLWKDTEWVSRMEEGELASSDWTAQLVSLHVLECSKCSSSLRRIRAGLLLVGWLKRLLEKSKEVPLGALQSKRLVLVNAVAMLLFAIFTSISHLPTSAILLASSPKGRSNLLIGALAWFFVVLLQFVGFIYFRRRKGMRRK